MQCYYEKQLERHRIMLDNFCMPIEVAVSLSAKLESAIMSCKLAIEKDARQDAMEAEQRGGVDAVVEPPTALAQKPEIITGRSGLRA